MTEEDVAQRVTFPLVKRVILKNFDLFSSEPNPSIVIDKPVFCLIGANGLGKSTFLNTVNYAITGAIPDPDRKFKSAPEYFKNASRVDRVEDYFDGRISEQFRPVASATVHLGWENSTVIVTRDIFGGGVSRLEIVDHTTSQTHTLPKSDAIDEDLNRLFQDEILARTGLEDFAQFVFLMHFVSTFDEGRHLLMWDDGALTNALYLAFGANPIDAKAADKLHNDMDRESSRGRNVRFSARHVADRIKTLNDLLMNQETDDHTTTEGLKAEHETLRLRLDETRERVRRKQTELRDADLKWTDLSARLTEVQLEYRKVFSGRLQRSSSIDHHPIIRASLSEDRCAICGTEHVGTVIQSRLTSDECPLCGSPVERGETDDAAVSTLRKLDAEIIRIRDSLATTLQTRDRVNAELVAAQASEDAAEDALRAFEDKYSEDLSYSDVTGNFSGIQKEIDKLEEERKQFLLQSKAHYRKRDEIREQLRVYERRLKAQYERGSEHFVPRFRELAEAFIGLPIDITLDHRKGANDSGFGLRLRMDDQLRLLPDTVSESQRFFLDIALRMALSEFMADGPATLFVDTPEGSLDIAYEARAGLMFSKFVADGNAVLMTANLRSSELVLRLANIQKRSGMQIVRMTNWTDLSEVQQSEETLFLSAYEAIDKALN